MGDQQNESVAKTQTIVVESSPEYKKLLEEAKAIVVDKIGIYTDFVVLGYKDIGSAKQEAIDMGVVLLNEEYLLKFLKDKKKNEDKNEF